MRYIRYAFILIIGLIIYTVIITGLTKYVSLSRPKVAQNQLGKTLTAAISETSDVLYLVKEYFASPEHLIKNDSLSDGVTYFDDTEKNWPKLLISYQSGNSNIVELVDLNTNEILKSWTIGNEHIKSNEKFVYYELRHPFLTKDSAVIGVTNGNLVKYGADSKVVWNKNEFHYHHALEPDIDGNLYVCGRRWIAEDYSFQENGKDFESSLVDDMIVKVNPNDGQILYSKSIIDILIENDYERLLYDNGYIVSDILHLNDIQPALYDSEHWNVGDLLVSLRSLSVVFLYRPGTNEILWLKQGPWLSQHDADYLDNDRIGIFGNDVLFDFSGNGELGLLKGGSKLINDHNNFYIYNFKTDEISTKFEELFKKNNIGTITSGRSELLDEDHLFIEETNYGRIIIGDSTDKKLHFVRKIDENHNAVLNWSRIIK